MKLGPIEINLDEITDALSLIKKNKRKIYFFLPAMLYNEYYSNMLRCVGILMRDIEVVVKIPANDYNFTEQDEFMTTALKNRRKVSAVILKSIHRINTGNNNWNREQMLSKYKEFCKAFSPGTVFFIDDFPWLESEYDQIPSNVYYISANHKIGGHIAADRLFNSLSPKKSIISLLIIHGFDKDDERVIGFENRMREICERNSITLNLKKILAHYNRVQAYDKSTKIINELSHFDGAFCTNDEMAIGLYDLVCERRLPTTFKIIGYDGTNVAQRLLQKKADYFLSTILQHPAYLAKSIQQTLALLSNKKLRKKIKDIKRVQLFEPTEYYDYLENKVIKNELLAE